MDDPGWRDSWRGALGFLFPMWRAKRDAQRLPLLLVVRRIFVGFATNLGLIGVVAALLSPHRQEGDPDAGLVFAAHALYALASFAGMRYVLRSRKPQLDATVRDLVDTFRSRFYLMMAFGNSVALVGFVTVFITHRVWPYFAGLVLAVPFFVVAAPTASNVRRAQEEARTEGSTASLVDGLLQAPTA